MTRPMPPAYRLTALSLLALLALTGPAAAEVCDKVRPSWSGTPVTVWTEPFYLYSTWLGWIVLLSVPLALVVRQRWSYVLSAALNGCLALILIFDQSSPDPTGIREFAVKEGCMGPPHVSIAIAACIFGAMTTLAFFGPRRQGEPHVA